MRVAERGTEPLLRGRIEPHLGARAERTEHHAEHIEVVVGARPPVVDGTLAEAEGELARPPSSRRMAITRRTARSMIPAETARFDSPSSSAAAMTLSPPAARTAR